MRKFIYLRRRTKRNGGSRKNWLRKGGKGECGCEGEEGTAFKLSSVLNSLHKNGPKSFGRG